MNELLRSRRPDPVGATVVLALSAAFAWCVGLRPNGGWFSSSWAHRLQTEAFFRGTFALQDVPDGQMADWAWAEGSQQVWGLGVPLLRFPFEFLARLGGEVGFPDRVTLLLAFAAVASVFASTFRDQPGIRRACLVVIAAFPPAFVTLCRTRLAVYEEASAFACLWGMLLAGVLMRFAGRPSAGAFACLGALAGVAPFFRPTLVFPAFATIAIAAFVARGARLGIRGTVAGGMLFAAGLAALATVNALRFGSPFETGQLLNVSYIPVDQFSKVFGYPYWFEPWTSALRELVSSLCLVDGFNGVDWYADGIHPWQSPTLRFREFYFTTFTPPVLAALVLGWVAVAAATLTRRDDDPRARVGALWSLLVFAQLFGFYLWAPSMTSRYAVDFAPAVATGLAAALLVLFGEAERSAGPIGPLLLALAGLAWTGHSVAVARISPTHATPRLVDAAHVREHLPRPGRRGAPLPDAYRCGENPERYGIKFNGSGWSSTGDCTVSPATMVFLPEFECVRVEVAPAAGPGSLSPQALAPLRAKAGLVELERRETRPTADGASVSFCSPPGRRSPAAGIELLYLGWMDPRLVRRDSRPLRLRTIAREAR